jgi:hypothetical protein
MSQGGIITRCLQKRDTRSDTWVRSAYDKHGFVSRARQAATASETARVCGRIERCDAKSATSGDLAVTPIWHSCDRSGDIKAFGTNMSFWQNL